MRRQSPGARWAGALCLAVLFAAAVRAEPIPRAEHPRPDLQRPDWQNLNGRWAFRFDPDDRGLAEKWYLDDDGAAKRFDRSIVVPFGWQCELSGVADRAGQEIGWYRREVTVPESFRGRRVWLCFGAVDWEARVWVNGREAGAHEGGYTPFALDITELVPAAGRAVVVVRARDASDPELPVGKQGGDWFTPTSGIWQTVYLEARPDRWIERLRLASRRRGGRWSVDAEIEVAGADGPATVEVRAPRGTIRSQSARLALRDGAGRALMGLDVLDPKLWTPETPFLHDLEFSLVGPDGRRDTVATYVGLRTVERGRHAGLPHEVILLNGEPILLRGALHHVFDPKGLHTAADDESLRRDAELARQLGFNLLRLHVKACEPRRLYWADRLGLLVIQDMPCAWTPSPRGRAAWESMMRDVVLRDRNHPSLVAWCLLNDDWGLGPDYAADAESRGWVARMTEEVKLRLDPDRLVIDRAARDGPRSAGDVEAWQFGAEGYLPVRRAVEQLVARSQAPPAPPGRPARPAAPAAGAARPAGPLLCTMCGTVSPRSGDRDVSWGFRYLVSQLRRHDRLQGYVFESLADVEWVHNGAVNYDRSEKEFGYDAFVPGMTPADLQGDDFIGFDGPPLIEVEPGEEFSVPIFVSHFSRRAQPPTLAWWITGTDSLGQAVGTPRRTTSLFWEPYRVTFQKPLQATAPRGRAMTGALCLELLGQDGRRIAANYVNLVVRPHSSDDPLAKAPIPEPLVEVLGPRLVALRFGPLDFAALRCRRPALGWLDGGDKLAVAGACEVEYHVELPGFVREALPTRVTLLAEMATRVETERLDWPEVRSPMDYPQTRARKHPGTVSAEWLGEPLWRFVLPDDPADSRGMLSDPAGREPGGYGFLVRQQADLTRNVALREALGEQPYAPLLLRAEDGRGLSIYGERSGRYPIPPTLLIETARDVVAAPGTLGPGPVAVHRVIDQTRRTTLLGGDVAPGAAAWRSTAAMPQGDWTAPDYDDSSWKPPRRPAAALPGDPTERATDASSSDSPEIWLRAAFDLAEQPIGASLRFARDDEADVYLNGQRLWRRPGDATCPRERTLDHRELALLGLGRNVVAVRARPGRGSPGVELEFTAVFQDDSERGD